MGTVLLFHAMDMMIWELARDFNNGALPASRGTEEEDARMHFAPGFDANPLVRASNPKDIAEAIMKGDNDMRRRTELGRNRFITDLLRARHIGRFEFFDALFDALGREPTNKVIVVVVDDEAVAVEYSEKTTDGRVANEFLLMLGQTIPKDSYRIMDFEEHRINDGSYHHTLQLGHP